MDATNIFVQFKKKVILLGLGRLQLGLVAPAFNQLGYELIMVNLGNKDIVNKLLTDGYYWVNENPQLDAGYKVHVNKVHHYDKNDDSTITTVLESSMNATIVNCALSLNEQAIEAASDFIFHLIKYRREKGVVEPLYITSTDNPVGAKFGVEFIQDRVQGKTLELSEDARIKLWNDIAFHVKFIPAIADRICSQRNINTNSRHPLEIVSERYGEIVFENTFLSIHPLYSKETKTIGLLKFTSNIELSRIRKLYTFSMAHAMTAYIGYFNKSKPLTIADAIGIDEIVNIVRKSLENISFTMSKKTGESITDWYDYSSNAISRIGNDGLNDDLNRVARDVPRKLNKNDRLFGPLILIAKEGFIISDGLISAIVFALLYALNGYSINDSKIDDETKQFGKLINEQGVHKALELKCEINLNDKTEKFLVDRINKLFEQIQCK